MAGQSTSSRVLKGASVLIFVIAILLFISSQFITYAARRLPVTNAEHQIIGETWIPHDYFRDQQIYGIFVVLSGLETWTIFAFGKGQR
jgi:ABC-type phosphate transport system permease subunit